ncbi:MAG: Rhs element Vgr protein, partial [Thermodesulfobacteriota bacterium]
IKITADGTVAIEGTKGVTVKASQDVAVTGMNVDIKANAALTSKGTQSAEFSAAGQTTLKGAMVSIN